ncbi:MAG TPA: 4-alpha-glucanotransferase [Thermoanaerobaculia bacterium]|nr:4-alpha-glucanotransferase [Thermoanaerobaculia bacterium]
MTDRAAGLLLHPTSLPGRFGIGDLGPPADRFLEWAEAAGQKIWQVLPLGPTGGPSPYGAVSSFAGNPLLISPERLVQEGLLPAETLADAPDFPLDRVAWEAVQVWKDRVLRCAWSRSGPSAPLGAEIAAFREAPEQAGWLGDWSRFAARRVLGDAAGARELSAEGEYQVFLQHVFFRQWARLKAEAARRGIALFGDVPIYVAPDSVDVASRPDLFDLDSDGRPTEVAGVPPDYFSATGQLWGYPLYRWDRMEEDGFAWWIERLRAAFRLTDLVRLDHFRGFAQYWAVPAGDPTAETGRWRPGPGRSFFDAVQRELGEVSLVAEDLGTITPDVQELLDETGIPGMKVLQFAFYGEDGPYLPHRHSRNSVVYTGTHDNDTSRGWWTGLTREERERVREYLGSDGTAIEWDLIRAACTSVADRAIVPVQDVFGLGSEARMNTPGEGVGSWSWRAREEDFTGERAARLRRLASLTGR